MKLLAAKLRGVLRNSSVAPLCGAKENEPPATLYTKTVR